MRSPVRMPGRASGSLDAPQQTPRPYPMPCGGLAHVRRHLSQPGQRVAHDRQQRVEHQSDEDGVEGEAE